MNDIIKGNGELIQFFPLPPHLYSKDIACLVAVAYVEEQGANLTGPHKCSIRQGIYKPGSFTKFHMERTIPGSGVGLQ